MNVEATSGEVNTFAADRARNTAETYDFLAGKAVPEFIATLGAPSSRMMKTLLLSNREGVLHAAKLPAENCTQFYFTRAPMTLTGLARFLASDENDGRLIMLSGDHAFPDRTSPFCRRLARESRKGVPTLVPSASPLLTLDVDDLDPSTAFPFDFDPDSPFRANNAGAIERLALMVLRLIFPHAEHPRYVVQLSASHRPGSARLRIFCLMDRALTLAEKRALLGPLLSNKGMAKASIHPGLAIDPAPLSSPAGIVYMGQLVRSTTLSEVALQQWLARSQAANVFLHSPLSGIYHDIERSPYFMPDPYAHCRVIDVPGEPLRVTDELLDVQRLTVGKANRTRHSSRLLRPGSIASPSAIAAAIARDARAIPWETGTFDAIKEHLWSVRQRILRRGRAPLPQELSECATAILRDKIDAATLAGNRNRANALAGYEYALVRFAEDFLAALPVGEDDQLSAADQYTAVDEDDSPAPNAPVSRSEAEALIGEAIQSFFTRPRDMLLRGTVGLGKTHATLRAMVAWTETNEGRIAFVAPAHKLARQVVDELNSLRPGVAARYVAADTDAEGETAACEFETDLKRFRKARGGMEGLCASCSKKPVCEFWAQEADLNAARIIVLAGPTVPFASMPELARKTVRKERERQQSGVRMSDDDRMTAAFKAPVIGEEFYQPHVGEAEDEAGPQVSLVVLDETSPGNWVTDKALEWTRLAADLSDALSVQAGSHVRNIYIRHKGADDSQIRVYIAAFNALKSKLLAAMAKPMIYRLSHMSGFTAGDAHGLLLMARSLDIHAGNAEGKLVHSSDRNDRKNGRAIVQKLGETAELIGFVGELAQALVSGGSVRVGGGDERVVDTLRRAAWHPHFDAPTLVLDATGQPALLRLWKPAIEVVAIEAEQRMPVYAMPGKIGYSTFKILKKGAGSSAGDDDAGDPDEDEIVQDADGDATDDLQPLAPGGLVTQKRPVGWDGLVRSIEGLLGCLTAPDELGRAEKVGLIRPKDMLDAGMLPGVPQLTFGNLRGQNSFGGLDGVVVIGRPLPPRGELERLAGALAGGVVKGADPEAVWPTVMAPITVRHADGSVVAPSQSVRTHPDAVCRALLTDATTSELLQAIGRVRALRAGVEVVSASGRTDDNRDPWVLLVSDELVPGVQYRGRGLNAALEDFDRDQPVGKALAALFEGRAPFSASGWCELTGLDRLDSTEQISLGEVRVVAKMVSTDRMNRTLEIVFETVGAARSLTAAARLLVGLGYGRSTKESATRMKRALSVIARLSRLNLTENGVETALRRSK